MTTITEILKKRELEEYLKRNPDASIEDIKKTFIKMEEDDIDDLIGKLITEDRVQTVNGRLRRINR